MKFFKFSTWLMAVAFAFASLQKVQAETVAKIEDVDYSSLQSAVAACWEGQTVVLMSDVDLGSDENAKIYLNHGQCRLDLNGRTISASFAAGPMVISVNEGTSLTICDRKGGGAVINTSTFDSIWNSVLNADNGGLIRVEGGSFVYSGPASGGGLFYDEGGVFEVAGGTFNADPTAYLVSSCTVRKIGDATWIVPAALAIVSPAAAVKVAGALSYEKVTIRTIAALQALCATDQVFIDAWENGFPQDSAPHYLPVSDTTMYYVEYFPGYGEDMSAKGLIDDYSSMGDMGINVLNNYGFYKGVPGGEENKCYQTLAEAVAAVDVGQTIVLFGDNAERVSGGMVPFMLQLNGYTYDKTRFAPAAGWMLKTESDDLMSYRELGSAVARVVSAGGSVTNDYETLAEAVATLKAGWTVTLLADCDETVDGRVMPFVLEKGGWAFSGEIMPADGFKAVESPIAGDDSIRYMRQDEDPVLTVGMKKVVSGFYQDAEKYLNATNFYITSRDGLAFFRGLVNGEDPAISAYIAAKCYGNDKKGFYTNNIFSRKTVVLLSDADLDDELWTPIGAYDAIKHGANYEKAYFYGNFDGDRHAVRNLKVSGTNTVTKGFYAGFFGYVQVNPSATNLISNLMLVNVDISGFDYVGGIAGAANQTAGRTVISNCHVIGSVSICSRSSFLGGIVGHGYGSVYDCSVVSSDGRGVIHAGGTGIRVGGIVGHNESPSCRIENCLVAGIDISMDYKYLIGGIAGTVFRGAVIRNCEVGDVRINCDASPYFGLIAGRTDGQSGVAVIEDCRVVNSTAFGRVGGAPVQCFTQNGEHANNEAYSIVGSNIVWQADGLVAGGVFENIAKDYIAEGYEKVSLGTVNPETWEVREVVSASVAEVISADGTVTNGYPTLAEAFANAVSADDPANGSTVRLLEDIDLAGVEWSPVNFRGTFDGNGKTISNLKVSGTMSTDWAGFFSYFRGAARDVTFVGADISGNRCGVFAAMVSNSGPGNDNLVMTFDNIRVLDSKITGCQKCGGLIGFFADSNGSAFIRNCTVDGLQLVNIDSDGIWQSAGLVGYLQPLGHEDVTFIGNTVKDVVCSLDGNSAGYVRSYASGVFIGRLENESDADRQHGETGYGTVILTDNRIEGTNTGFAVGPKTNDYIGDYITVDEIGSTFGGVKAVDVLKVEIDGVDITIPKAASVAEVFDSNGQSVGKYETLQAALTAAAERTGTVENPVVVQLMEGTIEEGVVKLPPAFRNVKMVGAPNKSTTIKNTRIMAHDGGAWDCQDLTFEGVVYDNSQFIITGWRTGGACVAKGWTFVGNEFVNIVNAESDAAIHFNMGQNEPVTDLVVTGNRIDGVTGSSNSGICSTAASGKFVVTSNVIARCAWRAMNMGFVTGDGIAEEIVIEDNALLDNVNSGIQLYPVEDAQSDAASVAFRYNVVDECYEKLKIVINGFDLEKTVLALDHDYFNRKPNDSPDRFYVNGYCTADNIADFGFYPYYDAYHRDELLAGTMTVRESLYDLVEPPASDVVAVISADGTTTNVFATLVEAVAAAEAGETVVMLADVAGLNEQVVVPNGKTLTLDLNGKTISGTPAVEVQSGDKSMKLRSVIRVEGRLTIVDSVGGGIVENTAEPISGLVFNQYPAAIGVDGEIPDPVGSVIVNGGTFKGPAAFYVALGTVTVNECSVDAVVGADSDSGTLVIAGGSFDVEDAVVDAGSAGRIQITDGRFLISGEWGCVVNAGFLSEAEVAISGGIFSVEPDADHIAEGYEAFANGTDPETWTVVRSYAITYDLMTEGKPDDAVMPGNAPKTYTVVGCDLPKPNYESTKVTFGGWLADGAETAIMAIPAGTTGELTLKAKWVEIVQSTVEILVKKDADESTEASLPIKVTTDWVKEKKIDIEDKTDEQKSTAIMAELNDTAANKNLKWQNYVLGLSDADPNAKVEAGAEQSPSGEVVQVESKLVVPPVDTGYKVVYALDKVEKGADTGDEIIGSRSETREVLIPIDQILQGDAKVGYAKLKAVLVPESGEGQVSVVPAANTIGIMKVESDLEKTIIPVPWGELGGGEIRVSNLIQVSNLTPGDRLYVYTIETGVPYDASKFESWELTAAFKWAKIGTITLDENGQRMGGVGKEADDVPVYRGQGVWLERQDTTKPIILSGQYNGDLATTPVHGTAETPVHNIVASPNAEMDVDLNEVAANAGEDTVFLPTKGAPRVYSFRNGSWGYVSTESTTRGGKSVEVPVWKPDSKIKSTDGFWYIGRGGRSNLDWKQTK